MYYVHHYAESNVIIMFTVEPLYSGHSEIRTPTLSGIPMIV